MGNLQFSPMLSFCTLLKASEASAHDYLSQMYVKTASIGCCAVAAIQMSPNFCQ